eukprot:CAMPEP_0195125270 /NCGR_PEP_ID=MMETSP0448-20130528/132700_1 /TAXON_ID=66468 /ORGANISM="Heterocapsa triquestra, Strain CCMP 448" /LENGTH=55 /DNA_ID=CAMNT_0040162899 /DNA_START=52 /DNA_END=215 /DNA_ORIENTATION=-
MVLGTTRTPEVGRPGQQRERERAALLDTARAASGGEESDEETEAPMRRWRLAPLP